GATTIRELQALTVRQAGDEVHIDVIAGAFCPHMVRGLVRALVTVGELRVPIDRPSALLAAGQRSSEVHVAPAHGLTLIAVDYPPPAELAVRAETARAPPPGAGVGGGRGGARPPPGGAAIDAVRARISAAAC